MAKKQTQKSVTVSDNKGNSTSVRPISNGFIIREEKQTKKGWESKETFTKKKPSIKF